MGKETGKKRYAKRRLAVLLGVLVILLLTWGLWIFSRQLVPAYVRKSLLPELSSLTGGDVLVEGIEFNPFPTYLRLRDLGFRKDGKLYMISDDLTIYPSIFPLLWKEVRISAIELRGFRINAEMATLAGAMFQRGTAGESEWSLRLGRLFGTGGSMDYTIREGGVRISSSSLSIDGDFEEGAVSLQAPEIELWEAEKRIYSGRAMLKLSQDEERLQIDSLLLRGSGLDLIFQGEAVRAGLKGRLKISVQKRFIEGISGQALKDMEDLKGEGEVSLDLSEGPGENFLDRLSYRFDLKGGIYLEDLMMLLGESEPLRGFARFEGTLAGKGFDLTAKGDARMQKGHVYGVDVDSVRCRISYSDGRMRFDNGFVRAYDGEADVDVEINLPHVNYFTVDVRGRNLRSRNLLKLIEWDPGLPPGRVEGWLRSEGGAFQPKGEFVYHPEGETPEDLLTSLRHVEKVEGMFQVEGDVIHLKGVTVYSPYSLLQAGGQVDISKGSLSINVSLSSSEIEDLTGREDLRGTGFFEGTVSGSLEEPLVQGDVKICKLSYRDVNLGCLSMQISHGPAWIRINNGSIGEEDWKVELSGKIMTGGDELLSFPAPRIDLSGIMKGVPLQKIAALMQLETGASGDLSGSIRFTGEPGAPAMTGEISIQNLKLIDDMTAGILKTGISVAEDSVRLTGLDFRYGRSFLKGNLHLGSSGGMIHGDLEYSLSLQDIYQGIPAQVWIVGKGRVGDGDGQEHGVFTGEILVPRKDGSRVRLGRLNFSIDGERIVLNGSLFNGLTGITGSAHLKDGRSWTMAINIGDGHYEKYLRMFYPEVEEGLLFGLSGLVRLKGGNGADGGFSGTVDLRRIQVSFGAATVMNVGRILMDLSDTGVVIKRMKLKAGPADFTISGGLGYETGYDLVIFGGTELGPFRGLIPGVRYLKGKSDFVFSLTGDWEDPEINGGITLRRVAFGIRGLPDRIRSFNAYAYVYHNRFVLEDLDFLYSTGEVSMKGSGEVKRLRLKKYRFEARVRNLEIRRPEEFSLSLDGFASLIDRGETTDLTGEFTVLKGEYRKDLKVAGIFQAERTVYSMGTTLPFMEKLVLNLNLSGNENIFIRNNVLNAPVQIDLVLTGSLASPSLLGRVQLGEGRIYFRNNIFQIIHASADFTDPARIHPYIAISARTRVRDYNIMLSLKGYPEQFDLALTSDPILNEVDIISLLTVGKLGTEVRGIEGGIGASEATEFLTGGLQDVLEERVRSITGFDRILVEPYVSETTGKIGPKVTVTKRLLSDKLYVTYTTTIDEEAEQILKLEFILNRHTSVIGERDENGSIGADIKFRYEFR